MHFINTNLDNVSKNKFNNNPSSSANSTFGMSFKYSTNFKITDNEFKNRGFIDRSFVILQYLSPTPLLFCSFL